MIKPQYQRSFASIFLLLYWFAYMQIPAHAACGSFTESTIKSSLTQPYGLTAGDYDGDGDIDIAVAERTADKITWYENNGSQVFSTANSVKTSYTDALLVMTFDIDEDGDPDLITTQDETSVGDTEEIYVFLNNGTGSSWTQKTVVSTMDGAKQIDVMDIDKDGDLDIVAADSNNDDVYWYANDGSENFTESASAISTADGVIGVSLGDIDGDTEIDVLESSQGSSQDIIWWENDGSESFSSNDIDTTFSGQYNELVDLDDDGDLDAVVASYYGYKVSWYANDGSGNFGGENVLPGSGITDFNGANHPHVGDLDNDGDQDIVVSSDLSNKFIWYENDGSETFTKTILKTSTDAKESFLVDLDGDGYTDIIQAAQAEGEIIWYKSNCTDNTPYIFFAP